MRFFAGTLLLFLASFLVTLRSRSAQSQESTAPTASNSTAVAPKLAPAAPANSSEPPPSPLRAALQLYRDGKFGEAEAAYNALLKEEPRSGSAQVGLMRVQLKQKRLTDAAASLAKAVQIAPKSDEVLTAQAELLFRQGRIAEAQNILTTLVKAKTPEARAYMDLGRIYWVSSYFQHAKLQYDLAHQRDKYDPDILKAWLSTLTRKERLAALKDYLAGAGDDDAEDREHLHTGLVVLEDAEDAERRGCHVSSGATELHTNMERLLYGSKGIRGYGLKVEVNGAKSKLLIDTGSTGILINKRLAEKAGIKPIVTTDVHGIGDKGTVRSFVGVADSIKIGSVEFQGCHIEVMDRNSVAEEDGLIGTDFFHQFLVNVNFPDAKFDLTPLPAMPPADDAEKALISKYPDVHRFRDRYIAPEMKEWTPVYRVGHMLLIPTRINNAARNSLFLIDTGAFSDTISPDAAREFTKVHIDDYMRVKGLNGAVNKVFSADEVNLAFSHFRQPARDMVAFDTSGISNDTGTEISGMLGFAMLYQMVLKIDYRDGLVDFGYDPKRFH